MDQRWGKVNKQSKKAINFASVSRMASLRQGDVLISSFLPSIGRQVLNKALYFNSQAEGQDSLRQAIMYDYNNKNGQRN